MQLSETEILALAPNLATANRSKDLAFPNRWLKTTGNNRAIWGEFGNPSEPFNTIVDLEGPGFQCSCPVRQLPCKHSIGLLLLFMKSANDFHKSELMPGWVNEWLRVRDEKTQKKISENPVRSPESEELLALKRQENKEKRLYLMEEGLNELESRLSDIFREGLASLEGRTKEFFQELATSLVDSKLSSLARRIRLLSAISKQPNWHEKVMQELGEVMLIIKGFKNLNQLSDSIQDDLLGLAGVNFKKEEILKGKGIKDKWLVIGQIESEEEGNLMARRTWLMGSNTERPCLLLDFKWGNTKYESSWTPGGIIEAEVVFYPSAYPQRVLLRELEIIDESIDLNCGYPDLKAFASDLAEAIATKPWQMQFPALLHQVIPLFQEEIFLIVDKNKHQLVLDIESEKGWELMALSGGQPISLFGEWNGESLQPLSVFAKDKFYCLAQNKANPSLDIDF